MSRLPTPGGDSGNWGDILNDFLGQAHNTDGSLKTLSQSQIQNLVSDLANKVDSSSFAAHITDTSNPHDVTKGQVGLGNVEDKSVEEIAASPEMAAAFTARWQANTVYVTGQVVLNPSGDLVTAKSNFTSGSSYSVTNWNQPIDTSQVSHMVQIVAPSGSAKNGLRISNSANSYALKVDQLGTDGVHDTVNIAANFTGGHTPFSVNSNNTTLSTAKLVNAAAQIGGAVLVAIGSEPTRSAQIIQADNAGSGASFLATQEPGATGAGLQVQYLDAGNGNTVYGSRAIWVAGHHTSGSLVYIENDKAQTSGNLMQLVQNNIGASAPVLEVSPFGTGPGIKINASGASILLQAGSNFSVDANGTVRPNNIVNGTSFNNASITPGTTGTSITRNIADGQPVLMVQNNHASSTGDITQYKGIGSSSIASRVDKNGYYMTRKTSAPADADIATGELAWWFDSTQGAAKAVFKGKDASGGVVSGSIPLS